MTYDDFSNLTAGQRSKLNQFTAIGQAIRLGGQPPDISAVTDNQAKQAANFMREVDELQRLTIIGIEYVRKVHLDAAIADYEANTPAGP